MTPNQLKTTEINGVAKLIPPLIALLGFVYFFQWLIDGGLRSRRDPFFQRPQPPLVMQGGDPYIRALMRTISASESNTPRPYSVLYGGQNVDDLSRHPQICVPIKVGPNTGNCSTAAGRYQVINTTWYRIAAKYHPNPQRMLFFPVSYSFEPEYQDQVVYSWLKDSSAWGMDISAQLRQGQLKPVLRKLSPTWTSLGYGIETNSMSAHLPRIYEKMLREELKAANPQSPNVR